MGFQSSATSASYLAVFLLLILCPTTEPFACTALWNTPRFRTSRWVFRSQSKATGTANGENEDDSVIYLSEEQLRRFWVKSLGQPESTYNEQIALTKMLMSDEDDDDDDFEESTATQYVPIGSISIPKASSTAKKTLTSTKASTTNSLGKRLLLRRRTTTTSSPDQITNSSSTASLPKHLPVLSATTRGKTMTSTTTTAITPLTTISSMTTNKEEMVVGEVQEPRSRSVGIDLGTTFSAVSCVEGGRPVLIPINGSRIVPSVVAYTKTGQVLVGEAARRQFLANTDNSYASVKRIIGKTAKEVKASGEKLSSHKIEKSTAAVGGGSKKSSHGKKKGSMSSGGYGSDQLCRMTCPNVPLGSLGPEDVSAEILKSLVDGASR